VANPGQHLLIADSGCDQTLVTSIWTILQQTGHHVIMTGAFAGRNVGERFPVVHAACKVCLADGSTFALIANHALYDSNPAQVESLLSVHQSLQCQANRIDDRGKCERDIHGQPGTQQAIFGNHVLPFYFDGTKCFFIIESLSPEEYDSLPHVILTPSDNSQTPEFQMFTRRLPADRTDAVPAWRQLLGFCPSHVVVKTLAATTQLVPTVEAETREIMRDHFQTRLPELKMRRISDRCFTDTFFSSLKSIRGYTCFQLYAFETSGLDVPFLMRRRSQSPSTLEDLLREVGAPFEMKSDNAPEFKGKRWLSILRRAVVASSYTEPMHPNQNLAERRGGSLKAALVHLLHSTGAPLAYWCFALEYVSYVRQHLAKRSLGWRSPYERHWGDTPDISVFRFPFWSPIWYYSPSNQFPQSKMLPGRFIGIAQNVGDAFCYLVLTEPPDNSTTPQVISRSVISLRASDTSRTMTDDVQEPFSFYCRDGKTPLCDPSPSLDDSPDILDDVVDNTGLSLLADTATQGTVEPCSPDPLRCAIDNFNEPPLKRARFDAISSPTTPPAPVDTVAEELPLPVDVHLLSNTAPSSAHAVPTRPAETPVIGPEVPVPTSHPGDFDGDDRHLEPPVVHVATVTQEDEDSSTLDPGSGSSSASETSPNITSDVTRHLEILSEDADDDLFQSIVGHEWKNGILELTFQWKTNETSHVPFTLAKRDYPYDVSKYILDNKAGSADARYSSGCYTQWA